MTGCGAFQRQTAATVDESASQDIPGVITEMRNLASGEFYVQKKGKYLPLYIGDATFDTSTTSTGNDSRICWFRDDFSSVPTLYSGDSLIYCNDNYMDEKFQFERFEYVGYTVGICGLTERASGRYSFNALLDDNRYHQIATGSDAYKLYELANKTAVIESFGGTPLLSGNITRGGIIKGLKKDGRYKAKIYIGTQLHEYSLIADTIALTSMAGYTTNNYHFLESRIARIEIPEWFQSGYYTINGRGMFRYVKGSSYTAATDFNVPNIVPDKASDDSVSGRPESDPGNITATASDTVTKRFVLDKKRKITVTVTWQDPDTNIVYAPPTAKIIGEEAAYTLNHVPGTTTLSIVKTLEAGTYRLVLDGLSDREYDVSVK